ncbi:MAG: hypothetical protein DMD95_08875 [Candidatus Rokuibacteriota bacterium]|nr:MAG: hypothetical protein DMD95_08875 [Candidatus Rokubacteria bacterium]
MIPAAFDYHVPSTVGEATALLARLGEDAKVLSGGQSLMPLMSSSSRAPALFEEISYDETGNIQGGSFIDYLLPTAVETPKWETGHTVTPSPHHPLGAKGVGESATVGAPAAIANAVVDALWHLGVRHIDIPITPAKVWKLLREKEVTE